MGLNALYSNTFSSAFITANEADFDEFIRLSTLASQNLINGIDPSEEEDKLYRMLILFDAIDNPLITNDDEETLRYCLTSFRVKTPTLTNFFSSSFLDTYCSSFTEFLRLMTEASERMINGKESKSRVETASRLHLILTALKNSAGLTADNIESLRYCLLNLNVNISTIEAVTTPCEDVVGEYVLNPGAGLFALSGQDVDFVLGTNLTLDPEFGSFTLTGQDVALTLGVSYTLTADYGAFTLTGQDVALTYTPPPYVLELELAEAIAGSPSWSAYFEMLSAPLSTDTLVATGNGATDTGSLASGGNILCNCYKTTNAGIAQDAGTVEFFINGVSQNSQNFIALDDVSAGTPKTYTFTGLSSGDTLRVEVTEG